MTVLHSSLDTDAGAPQRTAATPWWQAAAPQTRALWQAAFDAAQGAGGEDQPLDSASAAAATPTPGVVTSARETLVQARIESMTTGEPTDGSGSAEAFLLLQDRTLATNELTALTPQLAADVGSVAASSASLMDGFATSTASPKAGVPITPAPTIRLGSGAGPLAGALPGAAMTFSQAATPFEMALTRIDGRAAKPSLVRGAADLATGSQPIVAENGGARRQQALSEAQADPREESVLVFQRDHGIEIVVRHAALAPQAAVLCALETAHHLSGDRKALHQVTLNGRTVYDNSLPTGPPEPAPPGSVIRFSC